MSSQNEAVPAPGESPTRRLIKETVSLCPECLERIPAVVLAEGGKVWMEKSCHCKEDAPFYRALLEGDERHYYVYDERAASTASSCCGAGGSCSGDAFSNHSCNMLIEIVQRCNLTCPTCYANSSPQKGDLMELSRFEQLLDGLLEKGKGSADLIQISGGEPTVHPELIAMIRMALDKGVRQVYINTNGIKLASEAYVTALAEFKDRLGIYLQFDGFEPSIYSLLRGRDDLLNIKLKALAHCEAHKLSVVPVMTLTKGINDHQLGAFIKWASASPIVSKVMIQPAMYSGRYENEREVERLTVGEVAKLLATQTGIFCEEDFSPIPCSDPNCFSMAAALRTPKGLIPVSRYFPRYTDWHKPENQALIQSVTDTFDHAESLRSVTAQSASSLMEHLSDEEVETLLDQLVNVEENQLNGDPGGAWKGLFAIGIKPFMDAYTFDQDRIDKCCTHIIARDGTPVSFCEYNALNRPQGRL